MKTTSKILLGLAAVSGAAAYIINKLGSSKKDEPSFEDSLDLYKTDIEGMSIEEVGDLMHKLKNIRVDTTRLSDDDRREYVSTMAQFSKNVQKAVSRFRESGDLDDKEADAIEDVFRAIDSTIGWAKHQMD